MPITVDLIEEMCTFFSTIRLQTGEVRCLMLKTVKSWLFFDSSKDQVDFAYVEKVYGMITHLLEILFD